MDTVIDYYFAPQSPWTYLGHDRFARIAERAGARVRVRPVDLGGRVFPVSGGLPLGKRAPQRQAYRLLELRRFGEWLGLPINPTPKYFPVGGDDAALLIIAVELHDGAEAAMRFAGRVLAAVWRDDLNIADETTLASLLASCGLSAERMRQSRSQAVHELYAANTQAAIDVGVFGAPTYVIDGELFWGQDRLEFVERRLGVASGRER
jgi:2-hydroxychromene-2-carboxylate isomerase